jgi:hypothetical protein
MSLSSSREPLGGIDATKEALHLSTDPAVEEEEITHISCFVVRLEELLASRLQELKELKPKFKQAKEDDCYRKKAQEEVTEMKKRTVDR